MDGQVGFWKALRGGCGGTRIFFDLRRNSWGRVLFHLFLMSVLCAAFISVGQGIRSARLVRNFADSFVAAFGGVRIDRDGFRPERKPEKARSFSFSRDGRVFYFPAVPQGGVIPEQELRLTDYGVVWTPKLLVMMTRLPENRWQCSEIPVGQVSFNPAAIRLMGDSELPAYLSSLREPAAAIPSIPEGVSYVAGANVVPTIIAGICIGLFVLNFLMVFVLPLIYTAVFVLVFRLTGGRQLRTLSLGEFWRIGIYSGFPVMLFALCFPMFDLPFFQYGTVYMVGLVGYWLVVTGRIERAGIEGGGNSNE